MKSKIKTGVFLSHPIQYFSPIWRTLAKDKSLDLTVYYLSDSSLRDGFDPGFGRSVTWDIPLVKGYKSVFLKRDAHPDHRWSLYIPSLTSFLKKENPDCIVIPGYSRPFEWQLLWAAKRMGIKVIMRGEFAPSTYGNPVRNLMRENALRAIYRRVDAFAVIGKQAKQQLVKHGVGPEKMFSSPYCVDPALFSRRPKSSRLSQLRRKWGIKKREKIALFSGKLIKRKRPDTLIEAIAEMRDLPWVKAVLVGDGEERKHLEARADRLAPGRVLFPGFINQSELPDYFAMADVFVLPSEYETWGLVVNEAMHQGLPVLASDKVGCAADLVHPGVTGEVFPAGDSTALANHLRRLLKRPALAKKFSKNALRIIQGYGPKAAADGLRQAVVYAAQNSGAMDKTKKMSKGKL